MSQREDVTVSNLGVCREGHSGAQKVLQGHQTALLEAPDLTCSCATATQCQHSFSGKAALCCPTPEVTRASLLLLEAAAHSSKTQRCHQ